MSSFPRYLTALSVPCDPGIRLKSADLGASRRARDAHASDGIHGPEREPTCRRRESPSSNRARTFAIWWIVRRSTLEAGKSYCGKVTDESASNLWKFRSTHLTRCMTAPLR